MEEGRIRLPGEDPVLIESKGLESAKENQGIGSLLGEGKEIECKKLFRETIYYARNSFY